MPFKTSLAVCCFSLGLGAMGCNHGNTAEPSSPHEATDNAASRPEEGSAPPSDPAANDANGAAPTGVETGSGPAGGTGAPGPGGN